MKTNTKTENAKHQLSTNLLTIESLSVADLNRIKGGIGLHKILKEAGHAVKDINNHNAFVVE